MFNEVFPIIFGDGTDIQTVLSKVLCDSLVITPFICLPVAYLVKRSVLFLLKETFYLIVFSRFHRYGSVIFQYSFVEAISRYRDDVMNNGLLVKYWSLWSPVQCLTFSVVPQHLRIVCRATLPQFGYVSSAQV